MQIVFDAIQDALAASRPISWINTAAPFFVGYVIAAGAIAPLALLGTFYFLIPYNIMLYGVNDIFDYESDIKNPRKGGMEGALVAKAKHRRLAWVILLTNLPFIVYFLTIGGTAAKLWFAFCIFMNLAYSLKGLRFKEIPVLDSFTSATHFYSPLVYGLLLAGSPTLYGPVLLGFIAWGMASHAFGAVQDIPYDRQAGIHSIGTAFGLKKTLWFATSLYLVAAILPVVYYGLPGLLAGLMLTLYAINSWLYIGLPSDEFAPVTNSGWKQFLWLNILNGFWLTQLLLVTYNPFDLSTQQLRLIWIILMAFLIVALPIAFRQLVRAARQP